MKALGFNQGQYGDIVMGIVAAKQFKKTYPDSSLTLSVNKKYSDILPLFLNNEYFNKYIIWENYNDWPSANDLKLLEEEGFNVVFNPMPKHAREDWYLFRHQTDELCLMHGLQSPTDSQIELKTHFKRQQKAKKICLTLSGETRGSCKSLSGEQKINLCNRLRKEGFTLIQIGAKNEEKYGDIQISDFFIGAKTLVETGLLLTVDTCWAWIASGYKVPTVGLYGFSYYPNAKTAKNWMPINPNAEYLESTNVSNIQIDEIITSIKKLYD
jgi:ADP-heptose:LPS heptosyltransferase